MLCFTPHHSRLSVFHDVHGAHDAHDAHEFHDGLVVHGAHDGQRVYVDPSDGVEDDLHEDGDDDDGDGGGGGRGEGDVVLNKTLLFVVNCKLRQISQNNAYMNRSVG